MFKKIISGFCIFAIVIYSSSFYSYASYSSEPEHISFWDWYIHAGEQVLSFLGAPILDKALRYAASQRSDLVCPESPDGWHHGDDVVDNGQDDNGYYFLVECSECYQSFRIYSDELEQGYNDYINDNNLNHVSSSPDGLSYWQTTFADIDLDKSYYHLPSHNVSFSSAINNHLDIIPYDSDKQWYYNSWADFYETHLDYTINRSGSGTYYLRSKIFFNIPVNVVLYDICLTNQMEEYINGNLNYTYLYSKSLYGYSDDFVLYYQYNGNSLSVGTNAVLEFKIFLPCFIIKFTDDTSISVPNNIVVNNITYAVQNFDFTTRSFTVIDDMGDNVTITYGDTEYTIINNTTNITESYNYGSDNTEPAVPSGEDNSENWGYLFRWLTSLKQWLGEKLDGITGGTTIIENVTETVNNTDITYINSEGEEQKTSVKRFFSKFLWVKDVYSVGRSLVSVVSTDAANAYSFDLGSFSSGEDPGTELTVMNTSSGDDLSSAGAPVVYVDLSAANSNYGISYGGRVQILDLSWYTPYKSSVDNIVSGFLWLLFVWRLFSKAPGIISGSSLDSAKLEDIDNGERKGKK